VAELLAYGPPARAMLPAPAEEEPTDAALDEEPTDAALDEGPRPLRRLSDWPPLRSPLHHYEALAGYTETASAAAPRRGGSRDEVDAGRPAAAAD